VLATLAAAAVAAPAGAATPGTIAGTVPGSLPAKARGETDLLVYSLADRHVAAARTLTRSGRFSLRLPAGAYAIRTTIVDRRASRPSTALTAASLRAGQRRRALKLKVRRRPARRSARAAYEQESGKTSQGTAVSVEDFSGATGDWAVLNRGLTDMLITDLVPQTEKCKGAVVANSRDRKAIEGELNLQKSDAFDPATRVARDFIKPDVVVTGRLENAGGGLDVTLTLTDARSGEVIATITDRLSGSDWTTDEARLADKLARRVCRQPEAYQVAVKVQATGEFVAYRGQGTAEGLVVARAQNGDADSAPTRWQSEPSEISWSGVSFVSAGGLTPCVWTEAGREGSWVVSIAANGNGTVTVTTQGLPGAKVTANAICAPSPAPIGGQAGPSLAGLTPETFTVPAGGGTKSLSGSLIAWSSSGTITVRPSAPPG
jgi:TolB-like protein